MTKTKSGKNKRNSKHQSGSLSPEDRALWSRVTHDVTPLTKTRIDLPDLTDPKDNEGQPQWPKPHKQYLAEPPNTTTQYPSYLHGQAPGLDKRTQMRLKRGQLVIEARLDLHGMTQSEAHERMRRFLETSRDSGYRTVLVITGKGLRRDGQIGI